MFGRELNEQYLNNLYEDLQKEQMTLMTDMKTDTSTEKEKDITKQLTLLNTLMLNIMRLRNLKKQISQKINS
jgi:hypothetical protein